MIDHRRLGRELELFHSDPLVGAGLPIWLPDGAAARHAVESYIRELERRAGYRHVYSPPLAKPAMYERSGHLPHYADDMFPAMSLSEDDELILRPSLCPHHAMVFRRAAARTASCRCASPSWAACTVPSGQGSWADCQGPGRLAQRRAHLLRDDQVGAEIAAVLA